MERSAHTTLTLRAFFRLAKINGDKKAINAYYAYCNSASANHPSVEVPLLWQAAQEEARQIQLGNALGDQLLDGVYQQLHKAMIDPRFPTRVTIEQADAYPYLQTDLAKN